MKVRLSGRYMPYFLGILFLVILFAGPAQGQTPAIEAKKAEVSQAQQEIQATLNDVAQAQAAYDQAQAQLGVVNEELQTNQSELERSQRELDQARNQLSERAASSYRSGGGLFLDVLLSVNSFGDFSRKVGFITRVLEEDRQAVDSTKELKVQLQYQRTSLQAKQAQQAQLTAQMEDRKAAIDSRLQEQRTKLNSLNAETRQMIQDEQARQAREAAAQRAQAEAQESARQQAMAEAAAQKQAVQQAATSAGASQLETTQSGTAKAKADQSGATQSKSAATQGTSNAKVSGAQDTAVTKQDRDSTATKKSISAGASASAATSVSTAKKSTPVVAANARAQAILDNPNITMYSGVRQDIASGKVDSRILAVIEFAASKYPITLSAIKTGHPYGNSPTLDALGYYGYPNAHYFYRALDIAEVGGAPVSSGNPAAYALAGAIYSNFSPAELGSPWVFGAGSFSNAMHQNHIHAGWPYAADGSL